MSKYIEGQAVDPLLFSGDDIIIVVEEATGRDTYATINTLRTLLDTLPVVGGTANGVLYLNGSKVVTSGSGLTFDGTNLVVGPSSSQGNLTVWRGAGTGDIAYFRITGQTNNPGLLINLNETSNDITFNTTYSLGSNPAYVWQQAGSEQMRLNSTGLGIGTSSPAYKLDVFGSSTDLFQVKSTGAYTFNRFQSSSRNWALSISSSFDVYDETAAATRMSIDSSGNLGLGVTPSAWSGGIRVFEFGSLGGLAASAGDVNLVYNVYYDGADRYRTNGFATNFQQASGSFKWYTAPSGTAGNAISFTQAMTLTASGRLLIGQTADKTQEVVRVSASGQASLLLDNSGKTNGAFVGVFNDAALFSVNRNPSTGVFYNASNYAAEVAAVGSSTTSRIVFATSDAANTTPTERIRIKDSGQLRYVPLAADPAGAENGDVYYNSSTNKLRLYAAGAWTDLN
jgi:hypothetical protein